MRRLVGALCGGLALVANSLWAEVGLDARYFDQWDSLLRGTVDAKTGRVDYRNLEERRSELKNFIALYTSLDVAKLNDGQKKALYINFYNATMMELLLRYANDSKVKVGDQAFLDLAINQIKTPSGNIWSGDYKVKLANKEVNLDNIEHDLLRNQRPKEWGQLAVNKLDPRIHAAVNCAAISCPRVREKAYRPETVDAMLDENIKEFINNDMQFHKLNEHKLRANSIVLWYYDDFDDYAKANQLQGAGDYLARFVNEAHGDSAWLKAHLVKNFNDRSKFMLRMSGDFEFYYNWRINDQRNP